MICQEQKSYFFTGKILEDAKTLESYNIDASKFIVIMVTKPKTAPPPTPEPTAAPAEVSVWLPHTLMLYPKICLYWTLIIALSFEMKILWCLFFQKAKTEASAAGTPTTTPSTPATTTTSSSTTTTTPSTNPESGGGVTGAESFVVTGDDFQKMVQNLVDMGYDRTQV